MVVLIGQRKALAMAVRNNPEKLINAPTGGLRADKPQLRTRTGAGRCFMAAIPRRTRGYARIRATARIFWANNPSVKTVILPCLHGSTKPGTSVVQRHHTGSTPEPLPCASRSTWEWFRCATVAPRSPHGSTTVALPLHHAWYTVVLPSDHLRSAVAHESLVQGALLLLAKRRLRFRRCRRKLFRRI